MSGLCARERKHDRFRYSCRVSGTKSVQTLTIVATNRNRIPIHREESLLLPISRCEWRQLAEKEEEEEAEKRRQNTYQRQSHVPLQVHCAQFTSYVKHLPHDSLVIGTATNRTTKRNDRKNLLMHVRVEGVLFFFPNSVVRSVATSQSTILPRFDCLVKTFQFALSLLFPSILSD